VLVFGTLVGFGSEAFTSSSIPSDDFVFGAHRSTASSKVAGISVDQVAKILSERMDDSVSKDQIGKLSQHLVSLCAQYKFDPAFILSVIQTESSFNPEALSPVGAVGLMQLMPATARVVVRDLNPPLNRRLASLSRKVLMDPFVNVTLGVAYLASLRDRYRSLHPYFTLAAYNLGPARLEELLSKKNFKPGKTKKYYEAIRQGTIQFRQVKTDQGPA
jgi:soluble lytic murein transglycosylase